MRRHRPPLRLDGRSAPRPGRQTVSRASLNHVWPLTADHGTIGCQTTADGDAASLFITSTGKTYALNPIADHAGCPTIKPLRNGTSIGALRDLALGLCTTQSVTRTLTARCERGV
jgi:hypothetical protein